MNHSLGLRFYEEYMFSNEADFNQLTYLIKIIIYSYCKIIFEGTFWQNIQLDKDEIDEFKFGDPLQVVAHGLINTVLNHVDISHSF